MVKKLKISVADEVIAKGIAKFKEIRIWNTYCTNEEFEKVCDLWGYGYINIKGDFFSIYIK